MSVITKRNLEILTLDKQLVSPPNLDHINNASYDLTWSGFYRRAINHPDRWSEEFFSETIKLERFDLLLLTTTETVKLNSSMAGFVFLKSTSARNGLEHLHAGYIDPAFPGVIVLEVINLHPWPITIHRGQRIVQLVLFNTDEETEPYQGKYNNQNNVKYVPLEK